MLHENRRFGRLDFVPDPRDYPLAALLDRLPTKVTTTRTWPDTEPVLDQGSTGHCGGFGGAQWGNTLPVDDRYANADAHKLYYEAVAIGGVPSSENGVQCRWVLKALAKRGRVASYHLAASYDEALAWVRNAGGGSVMLGINWYSGMDQPTKTGLVHAQGTVRGGHFILQFGATASYGELLNSWSVAWGYKGQCHLPHKDLRFLVDQDGGEAWVAIEKPL